MKLNSHNEWDKLREVVVGTVEGRTGLSFHTTLPLTKEKCAKIEELSFRAFPKWLIDEANEDLTGLCDVLTKFGVKVLRPNSETVDSFYVTPFWSAGGDRMYNMRDLHLVVGNKVLETPSQERYRMFESFGLYQIWHDYFRQGCQWVAGPKPMLKGQYIVDFEEDGHKHQKLGEEECLLEAANVVRMGRDMLCLVSRSGNNLGAKWLQATLGEEYKVHTTEEIYRSTHIDSTVMCLKPGIVLLNAARVNEKNCPRLFEKWEKIYFSDIVATPRETIEFHENIRKPIHAELASLGISTDIHHMASDWIGMNFLSIDPDHIIIDKRQTALIKLFEKMKFVPIPISFRHSHLLKGGIHCSTLDTVRDSKLESYFD